METKLGHWTNYIQWCVYCIYVLHFHIKDAEVSLPFLTSPLIGSFRASISRDPFYDMLATRKRRIANKKWSLHPNRFPKSNTPPSGTASVCLTGPAAEEFMFIVPFLCFYAFKNTAVLICLYLHGCIPGWLTRESRGSRLWSFTTDVR